MTETPRKIFNLTPAEDERTKTILGERMACIKDPTVDDGAFRLFALILDLSLDPAVNSGAGVIAVSQTKLAEKLNCSPRTIYNRTAQLVEARYVWLSQVWLPSMKPMNVYHLTALHPPSNRDYKTSAEGLWGNGSRQEAFNPEKGGGARPRKQVSVETPEVAKPESEKKPDFAGVSRNLLPVSAAKFCGGQPKPVAAASRNPLRQAAETGCGGQPKPVAADSRNRLRRTAEASCQHKESQIGDSRLLKGVAAASPPPTVKNEEEEAFKEEAFKEWEKTLKGVFPSKLEKMETLFKNQLATARSDPARELLKRKLRVVRVWLYGPMVKEVEVPGPTIHKAATTTAKPKAQPLPAEKSRAMASELAKLRKELERV